MKFSCQISDPYFIIPVNLRKKCETVEELKEKIAKHLYIKTEQFEITNLPTKNELKSINKDSKLDIKLKNRCKNIKFHLPNDKHIIINECYKMTIENIIPYFESNDIFCFSKCIKHLRFEISNFHLSDFQYPFYAVFPENPDDEVKIRDDYVILDYGEKKFLFLNKSSPLEAKSFIFQTFKKIKYEKFIHIQNKKTKKDKKAFDKLYMNEEYLIYCEHQFIFVNISKEKYENNQMMDYFARVSDAKKRLAQIFCNYEELTPKDIIIYNNKKEVVDDNVFLKDIENSENKNIFFDIKKMAENDVQEKESKKPLKKKTFKIAKKKSNKSKKISDVVERKIDDLDSDPKEEKKSSKQRKIISKRPKRRRNNHEKSQQNTKSSTKNFKEKVQEIDSDEKIESKEKIQELEPELESSIKINFIFDENNEQKFKSFSQKVSINTTIKKLDEEISNKFDIDTKILIEYKDGPDKVAIDRDMTIEDVIEDIQNENENVLYIKITQKPKTIKSTRPKKTTTITHQEPNMTEISKAKSFKNQSNKPSNSSAINDKANKQLDSTINISSSDDDNDKSNSENFNEESHHKSTKVSMSMRLYKKPSSQISHDSISDIKGTPKSIRPVCFSPSENDKSDSKNSMKKVTAKIPPVHSIHYFKPKTSPSEFSPVVKNQKAMSKKHPENEINVDEDDDEDFVEPVKTTKINDKKHLYRFEYEEDEKEISLNPESFLEDNEKEIKEEFGLKESDQIEFNIDSKEEEKMKEINKRKMKTLKNFTIQIFVHNKQNKTKTSESKDSNKKYKYYYRTNQDDEINEIELEKGTTVKDFKEIISQDNEIENLSDIKIIFAGKDLLNDIVLDELNVGDTVLFIYIRTIQDILLMTAKALQFKKEDLEEESESDTDDD